MYQLHKYQQELVNKARQQLSNGKKSVLIISPAGSGKSVVIAEIARLTQLKGGQVMFTVHRKELVEQIIQSFKANGVNTDNCTIMTVGKIVNRLDKLPKPSLIITDETHHSLAKTYKKIYEYYSDVPRLGFTASPWRLSGKGLGDIYESMVEGPTVEWLIDNHYLAPYNYYSVKLINDNELKKSSTGDYTNKSIDDAVGKTIFGDVVKTYQEKINGQKTIVYAHSIEYSKLVVQQFNNAGIKAAHADSKTPAKEREHIMEDFRTGKIQVLSNVDLISEGFDVPDCTAVIMLRPTESLVLDIQQSMRCMRYKPNKTATIIDHVANYSRFGLPDSKRYWTLKDRNKTRKKSNTDSIAIKQCPKCFFVMKGSPSICPNCGESIKPDPVEMDVKKDVNLQVITNYIVTKKVSELHSYKELQEYAKAKNYKNGWVYYQAKTRGLL
ncbi:MAG: DEAD/DEAH box helicase [Companilactobacillus sp.]|jgi:superfamily II DNA or RNA helicase|uniref:Helicase n=1 Tax=Companilactobacillus ginsenosidimutans TaxID=1007676 RepID=A0A0H4QJL9_9LACO|nr:MULTISPECIES: DEAD/DEAH box helicase [Companilactobacillus]AKP66878.1 helicase [Companilactobacillus ginsenosidimutans]MCH4010350.1 DEAD/DEAH box helicase [Companilactobacillus sp.]MCH4051974.1 DEAD/DEAH box helicase [Companilactobacillus sp.]MCH4075790.1 DEAD/DEAH box helicase [Companilactobacillus sp.]MCH4126868.1 DEAD/DEAH box helicase [Companilactobacillus sp.]